MTSQSLRTGEVLDGRFEVLSVLGKGGFATVYKARQINIGRNVAIKILTLTLGNEAEAERLRMRLFREAQSAARIEHPDIVGIYDFGATASGEPFIVMELLQGRDLREELREGGPMAPKRALALVCRGLDALAAAHRAGIVHKDLKPSNLFVTQPGSIVEALRILDFGIAAVINEGEKRLTGTGQFTGTIRYCPPEYIDRQLVTPALDVYQMGLILIEMLTGTPVVDGNSPIHCIHLHASGQLPVPRALLQGPLGPVLVKALARDHGERFEDAGHFRDALLAVDPAAVSPPPPGEPPLLISDVSESRWGLALPPEVGVLTLSSPGPDRRPWRAGVAALIGIIGLGAALLLGVGVWALWAREIFQGAGAPEVVEVRDAGAPQSPTAPAGGAIEAPLEVDVDAAQAPEASEVEQGAVEPSRTRVALVVEPRSAQIHQGRRLLGIGRAQVDFDGLQSPPISLTISQPGFEPRAVLLKPTDGPVYEVALTRRRPAAAPKAQEEAPTVLP